MAKTESWWPLADENIYSEDKNGRQKHFNLFMINEKFIEQYCTAYGPPQKLIAKGKKEETVN